MTNWAQVAGARLGEDAAPEGSPTSFSDELFAVAFPGTNTEFGFAGRGS